MLFVDLPGYGYAKVSEQEKAKWGKMIENYLHSSRQLKAVFLLIDIRHEPSGNDKMMYEWICNQGYEPVIIATKLDKINRSQVQKHVKMIKEGLQVVKGTIGDSLFRTDQTGERRDLRFVGQLSDIKGQKPTGGRGGYYGKKRNGNHLCKGCC